VWASIASTALMRSFENRPDSAVIDEPFYGYYLARTGIDHPGRAFLALAVYYRHAGIVDEHVSPRIRELATARMIDRARILGGALRDACMRPRTMRRNRDA